MIDNPEYLAAQILEQLTDDDAIDNIVVFEVPLALIALIINVLKRDAIKQLLHERQIIPVVRATEDTQSVRETFNSIASATISFVLCSEMAGKVMKKSPSEIRAACMKSATQVAENMTTKDYFEFLQKHFNHK